MLPDLSLRLPWLLALLPLLLLLPKQQHRWWRVGALALFLLALAQPEAGRPSQNVALLIDTSDSVGEAAVSAADSLALDLDTSPSRFYFATDSTAASGATVPDFLDTSQTDIARALQVAATSGARRAVLISDGAESVGNSRLALPDFPVDTLFVPSLSNVRLVDVIVPDEVSPGETIEAIAVVESDRAARVTLNAEAAGTALAPVERDIAVGRSAISFRFQAQGNDALRLTAQLSADFAQPVSDDAQTVEIAVDNRSPVLIINDQSLANLLLAQGFDVRQGTATDIVSPLNYSAIIVRESAGAFTTGQLELLKTYVNNGGGLMMTGGPDSFGFGAWYRTPVEEVLPVNTDLRTEVELPLVALVIVLDRSQSMSTGNPSKLDLAKEGAISVVDLAYQDDLLGMIVFSDAQSTEWIFEPRRATERGKREMLDAILNINTQGGTVLQPAYEQAIAALVKTEASIKHVIILSDGKLYDGGTAFGGAGQAVDFNAIAGNALDEGITTSTIAIGDGADFERLGLIAASGGGRYYEALDVSTLPQIFTNEALTATRSLLREEAFKPGLRAHPLIPEGVTAPPAISAYIATSLKPSSETLLEGLQGEPVLAVTRQGLGRTAALTTDLNAWAGDLGTWNELPGLLGTVTRWLQARPADYAATVTREGTQLHVVVDAIKNGEYINDKALELRFGGITEGLEQVAPGRYEGYVPNLPDGGALLVVDGDDIVARSNVRTPNAEFDTSSGADLLRLIAERTGGTVLSPGDVYAPVIPNEASPLWPYPALAGLLLFLVELVLRRLVTPRSERRLAAGD